jgi:hypothetical protein
MVKKASFFFGGRRRKFNICNTVAKILTQNFIRRVTAGILLLLFAFSVTPKKTLHDLFAHHKDLPATSSHTKSPLLIQAGFRCQCDNLVVESPFLTQFQPADVFLPLSYRKLYKAPTEKYPSAFHFYTGLRGPPARA